VAYVSVLVLATLILFRTWLTGQFPSGTDSGFLYSALPLYQAHGAGLFTAWLSVPMGQVQQYSVYWFLTMVMTLLRSPLLTYDVGALAIAITTVIGMYGITWTWTHSRMAAVCAAGAYAFSPFAVSQWLDGHLDVATSIAVGPIAVWAMLEIIDSGSRRAAIALGLCGSALYLLSSGQAAYWLLAMPILGAIRLVVAEDKRKALNSAVSGGAVALVTFALCSAVQLVPLALGASAPFLQPGQSYYIESLLVHAKYSLPFLENVVGIPREIYLPPGIHVSFAAFKSAAYVVPQVIILGVALLAGVTRRAWFAWSLLLLLAMSWLLASGPDGPLGGIYVALWQHVPYFRYLRAPNRWLMLSTFCIATLVALGIARLERHGLNPRRSWATLHQRKIGPSVAPARSRWVDVEVKLHDRSPQRPGRIPRWGLAVMLFAAIVVVDAGSVLARGLPTMTPPKNYQAAYTSLNATPGDWRVLTTPVYQSWMDGPAYGDDETILADLGYTSTYYDSRNVVARGGWDPNASQFATAVYDMVRQGTDHHLAGLLGAAAIKYVVLDPEPAVEAVSGQNAFLRNQSDLLVQGTYGGFTVLRNQLSESQAYEPTSACVIGGGYDVLEDLSETPGFSFRNTAVMFADQLVGTSGITGLDRLAKLNGCLIIGPGGGAELAVLAHQVAEADATQLAPSSWPETSVNPLLDSESTTASSVSMPAGGSLHWNVTAPKSGDYRIWTRALVGPGSGGLRVSVDGRYVGRISTGAEATRGFRWVASPIIRLVAGSNVVRFKAASAGETQVIQLALVRGSALGWIPPGLPASDIVHDVDALNMPLQSASSVTGLAAIESGAWTALPGVAVTVTPHLGAIIEQTESRRRYYALANLAGPATIGTASSIVLEIKPPPNAATFNLNFYFASGDILSYPFRDPSGQAKVVDISPQVPPASDVVPDWDHVTRITVSANTKAPLDGPIDLQGPFLGDAVAQLPTMEGKLPTSSGAARPGTASLSGLVTSSAHVKSVHPGLLVFSQAYNADWQLTGVSNSLHTVSLGFANAYLVGGSAPTANLTYTVAAAAQTSTLASLAFWAAALLLIWAGGSESDTRRRKTSPWIANRSP
jgi:hypothetical protein